MKRFAEKREGLNVIPLRVTETTWTICKRSNGERYLYGDAADRLAAYEDTGYTPEEVAQMGAALKMQALMVKEASAVWNAQREGRVIVLPCKVGDMAFYLHGKYIVGDTVERIIIDGIDNQVLVGAHKAYTFWDFGRNVFASRLEAEAALEAKK